MNHDIYYKWKENIIMLVKTKDVFPSPSGLVQPADRDTGCFGHPLQSSCSRGGCSYISVFVQQRDDLVLHSQRQERLCGSDLGRPTDSSARRVTQGEENIHSICAIWITLCYVHLFKILIDVTFQFYPFMQGHLKYCSQFKCFCNDRTPSPKHVKSTSFD